MSQTGNRINHEMNHNTTPSDLVLLNAGQWAFLKQRFRMTNRELEIAKLICRGLSNDQIADDLNIKHGTVKTHVRNIYRKTWVNNKISMLLKFLEEAGATTHLTTTTH